MKPDNFRRTFLIEVTAYGIANLFMQAFDIVSFGEDRFSQRAGTVSALWGIFDDKYNFIHAHSKRIISLPEKD